MLPSVIVHRSGLAACCGLALAGAAAAAGPDLSLPRVIEQQANVFTPNHQEAPSLDFDASGNAFVVWGSRRQEAGTFGVFGRMFDAAGQPLGDDVHVNQFRANNQETPCVAFGADNIAWVVWKSHTQDGNQGAIVARRFGRVNGAFAALGDEFVVNEVTIGDQTEPVVAVGRDRVLVAWTSSTPDRRQVAARLYTADGTPVTDEMRLDNDADIQARSPVAVAQPDDAFVVAWSGRTAHGIPAGVHGLRIDADGAFARAPFEIAAAAGRHDIEPSLDVDAEGRFVAAWMASRTDARGYRVHARRFNADGSRLGDEVIVADDSGGWNSGAAIAVADDGAFVVTWNVEGEPMPVSDERNPLTPSSIMARRFDAQGQASGSVFRVNQHDEGRQYLSIASTTRRAAIGRHGQLAIAWNGTTGADGNGVGVTMVMPSRWTQATAALPRMNVDAAIVATGWYDEGPVTEIAPPDFDPNHVPDPPDPKFRTPGADFGFVGFQNTGWNPPDPDIAVGPNHIVVAVNGGIRFYTKAGVLQFNQPLTGGGGFWGSVGGGSFVFDPVLVFDEFSQRFIAVCTEHAGAQDAYLDLAVSDDDDPNGTWYKYRWNLIGVGGFIDFPNLGVGPDSIWVATDFFDNPTGNHIHRIDKAAVLVGNATTPESIRMSNGFRSTGAVKTYDADAPAQYFATSHDVPQNRIGLDAITGSFGNSSVTSFQLPVPTYSNPPGADQLGSSNRVATVGRRLKNGVYRNGSLWVAHTTGEDSTARVRWYEIAMNGWPTSDDDPTLVQTGTQNLGPLVHNWFADIHVDDSGNAALAFNQSSPNEYVSMQRTYRLAADSSGTLRPPALMQASTSPENGSRWGDYGGIEEDPAAPGTFWGHHEYRTSSWRTWVGKFAIIEETLPSDYQVVFGNYASGDIESLYFDDSDRLGITQRAPVSPLLPNIRVEIDGTLATTSPSSLGYRMQALALANPPNSLQRIALRNFDTNTWVTVDERFATLEDSTVDISFTSNFDQYIDDGTGDVRSQLSWFDPGAVIFAAWSAFIDQAVWTVTP